MNKKYLLLIAGLFLTGCDQISRGLVSNNAENIPLGHCRNYKVEPPISKTVINDSELNNE